MGRRQDESTASKSHLNWPQRLRRSWPGLQLIFALAIVAVALFWLIRHPQAKAIATADSSQKPSAVEAIGQYLLSIQPNSPLGKRLTTDVVQGLTVTDPILHVTGSVVASCRPGTHGDPDFWQFSSPDLLQTYSAHEKAIADEQFASSQLQQIRELAATKESALRRSIERLQKLVRTGTESERDLVAQQTELMQTEIQDRKDIYQGEVAVKSAHRDAITLALRMRQSGLDPEKLRSAAVDLDIVTAEVPEAFLDRVALGQSCTATFFGLPKEQFQGRISTVSPVLSTEQRTLRVLIDLADPDDLLRPGMFAAIGLGTDPRRVLRIQAGGVVHLGRKDYVFRVESSADNQTHSQARLVLRAIEVEVGETIDGLVEIRKGIVEGDVIVDNHAILLKPVLVSSLGMPAPHGAAAATESAAASRLVEVRSRWEE